MNGQEEDCVVSSSQEGQTAKSSPHKGKAQTLTVLVVLCRVSKQRQVHELQVADLEQLLR